MPSPNRAMQPSVVLDDDLFEDPDIEIGYSVEDQEEQERDDDQVMEGKGLEEGGSEEQEADDGEGFSSDDEEEEEEEEDEEEDFSREAAAGGALEITNIPTCPVCMEPWTSQGAHRISCIPCGHVYGRSCLEKWLTRCGNRSAVCPQCDKRFRHKDIINLYAPEVAIPNNELQKEISYLREKNISYLRERDDFQEKKMQAQIDEMNAALAEGLKVQRDVLQARLDQMQANVLENQKAQQDYFMSYITQLKVAIQAKFKQLGMPLVPFPPFQPPPLVESEPKLTLHTPPRPEGSTS